LPVLNDNAKKNLDFIERAFGLAAAPDCLYQIASEVGATISKIPMPEISRQLPLQFKSVALRQSDLKVILDQTNPLLDSNCNPDILY